MLKAGSIFVLLVLLFVLLAPAHAREMEGHLSIPSVGLESDIYNITVKNAANYSPDDTVVRHLEGTQFKWNFVLFGHNPGVMSPLLGVQMGDMVYVTYYGQVATYVVTEILIVQDNNARITYAETQDAILTLFTCYAWEENPSLRYVVRASRISLQ